MKLSANPVRITTAEDLGVKLNQNAAVDDESLRLQDDIAKPETRPQALPPDDPLLRKVLDIKSDGYAGVILSGPPGTSKSWFAKKLAASISSAEQECVRFIQFHPSYQYEDFIESYEPTESGGFRVKSRIFLALCETAILRPDLQYVLVIDELSRCDAVRVFGEALTYLEMSQRNFEFELASGRKVLIPENIFIIATMNPWDRGVDELDMAFERRFAKIAMEPDAHILERVLADNGLPELRVRRVLAFFRMLQGGANSFAKIGHAYFAKVRNDDELHRLWDHQLKFHFEKAYRNSKAEFERVQSGWVNIFRVEVQDVALPHEPVAEVNEQGLGVEIAAAPNIGAEAAQGQ